MKLHLGCGSVVPEGWVNVDYALGARMRRIPAVGWLAGRLFSTPWDPAIVLHDLRKPFPWTDRSAEAVYSSHTLEHLTKAEGVRFIAECARVLRPGGCLRIVVPNLRGYIDAYRDGRLAAPDFLEALYVFGARDLSGTKSLVALASNSSHRCMYDDNSLAELLARYGFNPRICAPGDSAMLDIAQFERPHIEWSADNLAVNLFVEGRR